MAFGAFFDRVLGSTKFTNYASENKNSNKLFSCSIVGTRLSCLSISSFFNSCVQCSIFVFFQISWSFSSEQFRTYFSALISTDCKAPVISVAMFFFKKLWLPSIWQIFSLLLFFPGFLYATKTTSKSRNLFHFFTDFGIFWHCFRKVLPENNRTYVWQVASKIKQDIFVKNVTIQNFTSNHKKSK